MNDANNLVRRVVAGYGLTIATILPPQKGYRNQSYPIALADGRTVNLILYKSERGVLGLIYHANEVSDYLAQHHFACRTTLGPVAKLHNQRVTRYAALYSYLPGRTIPWEAYTMKHIKLLGKTLSDMHAALTAYAGELPRIARQASDLQTRMTRYFADAHVRGALLKKLNLHVPGFDFAAPFAACQNLPGQQALHMDFVRGNILFDGEGEHLTISGILDFEKTAWGHPLFDIARTLAFLLVDCKYKSEPKIRKYFLHSGYGKRGAAELPPQTDLLEQLVGFYLLHDFYKFLRHNPYESLPANEHFVRTRDLLLARSIIE